MRTLYGKSSFSSGKAVPYLDRSPSPGWEASNGAGGRVAEFVSQVDQHHDSCCASEDFLTMVYHYDAR